MYLKLLPYRARKYLNNRIEQDHRFINDESNRAWNSPHIKQLGERYKAMKP
jgi:transposase-like protein